jgi:hypothetical protein
MATHAKGIRKLRRDAQRRALALFERRRFLRDASRAPGVLAHPNPLPPAVLAEAQNFQIG